MSSKNKFLAKYCFLLKLVMYFSVYGPLSRKIIYIPLYSKRYCPLLLVFYFSLYILSAPIIPFCTPLFFFDEESLF